jgi:hypothetical protein
MSIYCLIRRPISNGARVPRDSDSHRWHTEALGSSAQIRCVSRSFCMYRVMTKSASRAARTIQILIWRIRIARSPAQGLHAVSIAATSSLAS